MAAGAAGYAAINISALLAAVEFGLQPLLFRDALGAPLYCPYPLSVSIPAMMIGHLTVAGMAELIVSAGLVALLQQSDPSLLRATAGAAAALSETRHHGGNRRLKPLWAGLCMLMILTPLGILAAGTAWGEWVASDFSNPAIRQQIAGASLQQAAPEHAPKGLEQISQVWTAPFSHYAPPYIRSASFGYFLSAMFGAGLIILASFLMGRFMRGFAIRGQDAIPSVTGHYHGRGKGGFIEHTIQGLHAAMGRALCAEHSASTGGMLQRLDPRVKVAAFSAFILVSAAASKLSVVAAVLLAATIFAALSRISLWVVATRVWLTTLTFSGALALPAVFLTPGTMIQGR